MFVVLQTYRIRDRYREEYLDTIRRVVEADLEIGCVSYQVLENADRKNEFTEVMTFDSWSHYERIRRSPASRPIEHFSDHMDDWIEGGADAVQTSYWTSVVE